VPDYLASELADAGASTAATERLGADGFRVELVSSERVTHPPAAPLYSVMCRYTCGGTLGKRLFRSERYRPMAAEAFALRD